MWTATLAQARVEIKVDDPEVTVHDPIVMQALHHITSRIEDITEKVFVPRLDTLGFDALGYHIDDQTRTLSLGEQSLLQAISIVDGEGNELDPYVRSTREGDYLLRGNDTPYFEIALVDNSPYEWSNFTGAWQQAIQIEGVWGWRKGYVRAWQNSGDTVEDNPLSNSAVIVKVNDAGATNMFGLPRFSPGQRLRIATEYVDVQEVNVDDNELTVERGVGGTEAAQHAQNAVIEIWLPQPEIERATLRWASYLYKRRGDFENTKFDGVASIQFPPDIPDEAANILAGFMSGGFTAV